ncbi:MAG: hypothetical protein V3T08_09460 [Gemmatimonadota bacterium]
MAQQEFRETSPQGVALREAHVEGDVIQNVALLGSVSLNNRTYTEQAMKDAARLYNGAPVFIDHPTETEMQEREGVRSVMDLAGQVLNARLVGGQVRGDIQIMNREPTKGLFLAIAEQMPGIAGMSHRARGVVEVADDGKETVTSIDRVFAVELVADPATTAGLFESVARKQHHDPLDLRSVSEQSNISFDDIRKRVRTALTEIEQPGDNWLHIEAIFDDRVIYQIDDGPMFQRSWEMDGRGNVTLGNGRIEVQKLTTFEPITSEPQETRQMDTKDLTLASLKEQRPDLVKSLTESVTEAVQDNLKDGEATKALEVKVTEAETKAKGLAEENDGLKVKEAERERQSMIDGKLKEAELPETAITDHFKEQLKAAKDEAAVDAVIADRKALVESVSTTDGPRQPARDISPLIGGKKKFKEVTADTITGARKQLFG